MSEWLKEHAWKACIGISLSRVRIPPSPPLLSSPVERLGFFVSGYCTVIRVVRQGENPRGFESSAARQRRSLRRRPEGCKSSLPHRHYSMKEPRNAGLFCGWNLSIFFKICEVGEMNPRGFESSESRQRSSLKGKFSLISPCYFSMRLFWWSG